MQPKISSFMLTTCKKEINKKTKNKNKKWGGGGGGEGG